jgi:hypothetical protein
LNGESIHPRDGQAMFDLQTFTDQVQQSAGRERNCAHYALSSRSHTWPQQHKTAIPRDPVPVRLATTAEAGSTRRSLFFLKVVTRFASHFELNFPVRDVLPILHF